MSFYKRDDTGKILPRYKKAVINCSNDPIITEQSHAKEVDINNIVKRAGAAEMIAKTAALAAPNMRFDNVPGNDFQEAMNIVLSAQETFDGLPAAVRKRFDNNPAKMLDFVQDPANGDALVGMGLAAPKPVETPIEVVVTNPEPAPATT